VHDLGALVEDMGANHYDNLGALVDEDFLYRAKVTAVLRQVRGEGCAAPPFWQSLPVWLPPDCSYQSACALVAAAEGVSMWIFDKLAEGKMSRN